jgi:hypothetical protein
MSRKPSFRFFCLALLLFAEAIQGLTPDVRSLSSTKLAQITDLLVGHGGPWATGFLNNSHDLVPTETSTPPFGSAPFPAEESDEVCLASFTTGLQLVTDATDDAHGGARFPCDLVRSPIPSRYNFPELLLIVGGNHSLIHSLCRLTC